MHWIEKYNGGKGEVGKAIKNALFLPSTTML